MKKVIAVTGCPTGVAHTFMAEEALRMAAEKAGVPIKIETNGASGVENAITAEDLTNIYGVIIAADKDVNPGRFDGLPVIEVPVKQGIHQAAELIQRVIKGEGIIRQPADGRGEQPAAGKATQESVGRQVYKHLMSGVSNMLPFVVSGGILIALSFLWGIYSADPTAADYNPIAATLMKVGQQAFAIMVPVFTAFIAFSVAGRPGMVAGFVGGLLANATGAGFLGGIIAGFFAGYFMLWMKHLLRRLPRQYEGLKSIFLLPLSGVLVTGVLMVLLGQPVAAINNGMMLWLSSLQQASPVLLGIVVGAMCSFDFGGPVNKAAYVTGTLLLAQGNDYFMAGVSAACITPPLVIAFATTLFPKGFTTEERAAGLVNYILGCTHITEGAIPFAAKDPVRVIPLMMIASSISAVLSYSMHIQVPAPHGGFLILPLVNKPLVWVACILAGSLVGAVMLGMLKIWQSRRSLPEASGMPTDSSSHSGQAITLTREMIHLEHRALSKDQALTELAATLHRSGLTGNGYLQGIRAREAITSTYLGNGIAVPHGTPESRDQVINTGVRILACPQGVDWGEGNTARLIIAIAAKNNEHLEILRNLARLLGDDNVGQALMTVSDEQQVLNILQRQPSAEPAPVLMETRGEESAIFVLANSHGLHARPAAELVRLIRQWPEDILIENLDRPAAPVSGRSMMKVIALGAKQGHRLKFTTSGPNAREALAAISTAFEQQFGEQESVVQHQLPTV